MGLIIYIIGIIATVYAIMDVFKKNISTACKLGVTKNGVNRKIKVKAKNLNSLLLLHKYEINGQYQTYKSCKMIPV